MEIHLLSICPYQQVFILKPVSVYSLSRLQPYGWFQLNILDFFYFIFFCSVEVWCAPASKGLSGGAKRFLIDALFDNCIEPGRKNRHEENVGKKRELKESEIRETVATLCF